MATQRLESGQMQLRSVGGVPMVQPQQQAVDFVGPRAAAQGASQLAQVLDRMSASAFQLAAPMRQQEGFQYVADNKLTIDQIQKATEGVPLGFGSTSSLNYFDQAVAKARSLELANHFEEEGKNVLVKILDEVEAGTITSAVASSRIKAASDGLSKAISSNVDPEAVIKFRATMATHGNTVLNSALKAELKRNQEQNQIKFVNGYANSLKLLEQRIAEGSYTDASGVVRPVEDFVDMVREQISTGALLMGNAGMRKEYLAKFEKDVKDAKIFTVTKALMAEENMVNPEFTLKKIEAGDLGNLSPVLKSLIVNDYESVIKIKNNYRQAIQDRKQGIDFNLTSALRQGDTLLRKIYSSNNIAEQKDLFSQLSSMPVSPESLKTARAFITDQGKEGRPNDDFEALGRVSQRVALGLATQAEISSGPFTNATKRQLTIARSNPSDDVNYATNQINLSVGIQAANLPPELKDSQARQKAVETRNDLVMQLHQFTRTPNENGLLPNPTEVRKRGDDLAKLAKSQMSGAFEVAAINNQKSAVLSLPELNGVDLTNEAAVNDAFAKATARKANTTSIAAAKSAVDDYRTNTNKAREGKAK